MVKPWCPTKLESRTLAHCNAHRVPGVGEKPLMRRFYTHSMLYLHDLTQTELRVRRHQLQSLINRTGSIIQLSGDIAGDGDVLLANACALGFGIIAKNLDRNYRSGRTGDWIKVKCIQSESFFIVGYEQSPVAMGQLGSLQLAAYRGKSLVHVRWVGTGFNRKAANYLRKTLDSIHTRKPEVQVKGKNLVYSVPFLIAEIEFRGWANEMKLRHASYKGLRWQWFFYVQRDKPEQAISADPFAWYGGFESSMGTENFNDFQDAIHDPETIAGMCGDY